MFPIKNITCGPLKLILLQGSGRECFLSFLLLNLHLLSNSSSLPSSLDLETEAGLTSINFSDNDILKMIKSLDINKAHGHDNSICDDSIKKSLSIIYKNCINTGIYPNAWKKSNIVPVHKKGNKQIFNNYRPVSLLPIFGEVFEKILFNSIFEYLQENCLLCDNQSGFQPSDSCEYQLLSIVHIYTSFDCNTPEDVRGILTDIFKAFDRVWHEGVIYKMKCIGITGMPLKLLQNFLQNIYQKVLLNDIDVPEHELKSYLRKLFMWAYQWKMSFNPDVSKLAQELIFSKRTQKLFHPTVLFNNIPVQHSTVQKHLGVYLDKNLNFNTHNTEKIGKAGKGIRVIKKLFKSLPRNALITT